MASKDGNGGNGQAAHRGRTANVRGARDFGHEDIGL
jgi:hypothetical protein